MSESAVEEESNEDSEEVDPKPKAASPAPSSAPRVAAIDIMRGFVMVLMAIDHASEVFNSGRIFSDSFFFYHAGDPLPAAQFLTRWITHLCAPTFVTLAGTALAMSTESRRAKGQSEKSIDRHILVRGALIVLFELVWMSFVMVGPGRILLQVLWAIGSCFICMSVIRRLGDRALLGLGIGLAFGSEILFGAVGTLGLLDQEPLAILITGGLFYDRKFIVAYPTIPWLAMMCLGWSFGRALVKWRAAGKDELKLGARALAIAGIVGLVFYGLLRAKNTYGNMLLTREDQSIIQWLHVSKYPPSATYIGLELGIASLILAALMWWLGNKPKLPRFLEPLRLFGSTALFFYLLHIHLLTLFATLTHTHGAFGLKSCFIGALAILVLLYPACAWYRRYKTAHPNNWSRFI